MRVLAIVGAAVACVALQGCGAQPEQSDTTQVASEPARAVQTAAEASLGRDDLAADSAIVMNRIAWARAQHLDTLATGALMARLGRTFVGTPYVPQTLDPEGPERLVINLRAFDCVTFVESMLALARTIRAGGGFPEFVGEVRRIRYRTGEIEGYPSRLHYFSEWIAANTRKGIVQDLTQSLGGTRDTVQLEFMSGHRDEYRQLRDDSVFQVIRAMEQRLAGEPRYYVPKAGIAAIAPRIRDGDVIAATSALPGMDVAHTGIALWQDGQLHLMHAPLVGDSVEISAQPLAVRIQGLSKQDGIMVARPR